MAEKMLDGSNAGLPDSEIKYFAKEDGSAALVYSLQVKNEETGTWFEALVDAHSKEMVSVVDYVAQATVRSSSVSFIKAEASVVPGTADREEDSDGRF
jgi:hypothetical protein